MTGREPEPQHGQRTATPTLESVRYTYTGAPRGDMVHIDTQVGCRRRSRCRACEEVRRMNSLNDPRQALATRAQEPTVVPTGEGLGALVEAVDLAALTDTEFTTVTHAWLAHSVLVFRDQV